MNQMLSGPSWQQLPTRTEASALAAVRITEALAAALAQHGKAMLVVPGGSTPADCLTALSQARLDWHRIIVTLTDERCVPEDHEASNARMVRECLLRGPAASATLLPLTHECAPQLAERFACVLLGVGTDGHFASLFPDLTDPVALEPQSESTLISVRTAASTWTRISMTLARLLRSDRVLILAFGDSKRSLLEAPGERPVARLLTQQVEPLEIIWAA